MECLVTVRVFDADDSARLLFARTVLSTTTVAQIIDAANAHRVGFRWRGSYAPDLYGGIIGDFPPDAPGEVWFHARLRLEPVSVWMVIFARDGKRDEIDARIRFYRTSSLTVHMAANKDGTKKTLAQCIEEDIGSATDYEDHQVLASELGRMKLNVERIVYNE